MSNSPSRWQKAFSMDSPIMSFMSRVADLMILNLLFLLTSVPVVTIGASITALNTVCLRFGTDRERGVFLSYFRAFRDNFKQATVLWLILLFLTVACLGNVVFFYCFVGGGLRYLFVLFAIFALVCLGTLSFAFPLQSQFENTVSNTLKNALVLSLAHFPRTIVMIALVVLPWVLLAIDFMFFLQLAFIWVALYFSTAVFISSRLLKKVFAPFMPKEDEEETEEDSQ